MGLDQTLTIPMVVLNYLSMDTRRGKPLPFGVLATGVAVLIEYSTGGLNLPRKRCSSRTCRCVAPSHQGLQYSVRADGDLEC